MSRVEFQRALIKIKCRTQIWFLFSSLSKEKSNNKFRFDGTSVEEAKSFSFGHNDIHHLAKYLGQPFTTGCGWDHAKTEIMRLESGEWESGPDYPFHSW